MLTLADKINNLQPNETILIYRGSFIGSNRKKYYSYVDAITGKQCNFNSKLSYSYQIGNLIKCFVRESNYSKYEFVGQIQRTDKYYDDIEEWTLNQKATLSKLEMENASKKVHEQSIELKINELLKSIKYLSSSDKKAIALRIYTQIMSN